MQLVIRYRKKGSERFAQYNIDDEQYSLDDLQKLVNYGVEHRTQITVAVDMPRKKFVKLVPMDMSSISVLYEHE